jgi:hypothetical protein
MKKLEFAIRGLLYLLTNILYFAVAAWVGEGLYGENGTRVAAVMGWIFWNAFGAMVIEFSEAPKEIVKALTEDFGK